MVTLATLPTKTGTVSGSGFIHLSEGGADLKLIVNDFLTKIASQYSTDINAFLASLSSVAGFDSLSKKGADVASATTTNLDTATGNYINITGTATITGITLSEGKQRLVRFVGALILTNGANLVLPNAANITTAANDFALFVGDAAGVVRCAGYFRKNTLATESTAGIAEIATSAEAAAATSDTTIITPLKQRIVQVVNTQTGAVATGTTVMPYDDTIPQNTEGNEYMTLAITPTSATNKLLVQVITNFTHGGGGQISTALFQDATASALAVTTAVITNVGNMHGPNCLNHYMTSGTTSATTFRVRIGSSAAGTTTFNGTGGARRFGGVFSSSITITEIKA